MSIILSIIIYSLIIFYTVSSYFLLLWWFADERPFGPTRFGDLIDDGTLRLTNRDILIGILWFPVSLIVILMFCIKHTHRMIQLKTQDFTMIVLDEYILKFEKWLDKEVIK